MNPKPKPIHDGWTPQPQIQEQPRVATLVRVVRRRETELARCRLLLAKLARIDTDGQSAEHVANLAVQYASEARDILCLNTGHADRR